MLLRKIYFEKGDQCKADRQGRPEALPVPTICEVTKRANEGDAKAAEVKQAFLLQVAKDIGAMACVLNGKVDQIVITGGIAYGEDVVAKLKERCGWIAPVTVYP